MYWWDRALQSLQQGARGAQQTAQRVVRVATRNPAVAPIIRSYRQIPPSVRTAINPLSRASIPIKPGPIARTMGAGLLTDELVSQVTSKLPKEIGGPISDFWTFTSLPVGGPLARLAAYAVLAPQPAGATEEAELQKIRAEYERQKTLRSTTKPERTPAPRTVPPSISDARGGLRLAAPYEAAFAPQPQAQQPAATVPPSAPPPAAVRTAPQAQPKPSQEILGQASQLEAPTNVPLAQFYRAQSELGAKLGATELVRLMKETGRAEGVPEDALIKWATQNPGLAYREVLKGRI